MPARAPGAQPQTLALLTTGTLGEPAPFANAIIFAPGSHVVRGNRVAIGQIGRVIANRDCRPA